MSNRDVFGRVIGMCDNCRRMLYEGKSKIFYVRFQYDQYCFCDYCVTVIDPSEKEE